MIKKITLGFVLLTSLSATAQDDLMKMLADNQPKDDVVLSTFKSSQIINANTTEFLKKRNLDFRVTHKFQSVGAYYGHDVHDLYGFDQASDINIAFNYGLTDDFMVGVNRSLMGQTYMGFGKYAVMRQTTNNHIPVSVAVYANSAWNTAKTQEGTPFAMNTAYRGSYVGQVIIARKFSRSISFEILPTFLHRNFVANPADKNDIFALGVGGRVKVSRSSAIVGDYFYTFSKLYNGNQADLNGAYHYPSLGLGWELETGGHVFTMMFSNNSGIIENNFLTTTNERWAMGGFRFSFIISRVFKV